MRSAFPTLWCLWVGTHHLAPDEVLCAPSARGPHPLPRRGGYVLRHRTPSWSRVRDRPLYREQPASDPASESVSSGACANVPSPLASASCKPTPISSYNDRFHVFLAQAVSQETCGLGSLSLAANELLHPQGEHQQAMFRPARPTGSPSSWKGTSPSERSLIWPPRVCLTPRAS